MIWNHRAAAEVGIAVVTVMMAGPALATEGYFQHGYGARSKALAGAGVADGRDATAAALNPAGLAYVGNEIDIALSFFSPRRSYEGSDQPGFTPQGRIESDSNLFYVPTLAANYRLPRNPFVDTVAFSVYGNGGMNTDYPTNGGPGLFGAGPAGVNLQQAFIALALAKSFGNVSVGVAPIVARQQFEAVGLANFGVPGSVTDVAWGTGVRGGIEWRVAPNFRLGVAGTSPIWSQSFEHYGNLFAQNGHFDIPASIQAGLAYDLTPRLTLLADYRHVWYGSVPAISNPSTNALFAKFGSDNGPGFGWRDVDVFKVGAEWRSTADLTLRAGYAYATSPLSARDVQLNILAPAVVQHQITAGAEYRLNAAWSVELAGLYAPEISLKGQELPAPFGNPGHTVEISMQQFEATFGVKYKFDAPGESLK